MAGPSERVRSLGLRAHALERLQTNSFDLLVVGGGITGAGVALEGTLRGYRTALVEQADFASGTSRRSSKLIHGGLRYLGQGAVEFVREALQERSFLLAHAPGVVAPLAHLIPLAGLPDSAESVERLLSGYEALAGPHIHVPRHRQVAPTELAARVPILRADRAAAGGYEYFEARTDDARLTMCLLRAASARGAVAANHLSLTGVQCRPTSVDVELRDALSGARIGLTARSLVLAVGPWLPRVRDLANLPEIPLQLAKGVHVVLRQTEPRLESAMVLRHPADGRPISIVPWNEHLLLGTTDTSCEAIPPEDVHATSADVDYLLQGLRHLLPDWTPTISAAWAGVRPLWADADRQPTADLPREDRLLEFGEHVIGITGGKLTTFRQMGRRVVDMLDARGGPGGVTGQSPLSDIPFPHLTDPLEARDIEAGETPLLPGLRFTAAHLRIAAEEEMAVTLDDVLTQRLGISLVRPDEADARAYEWAAEVGAVLGWQTDERQQQAAAYRAGLSRFRLPPSAADQTAVQSVQEGA